ncbi:MAG: hypothetical protein QF684_02765 [Candidatus Thalassarchaeaceae archaeon]|nr:hypothetical protein [Candidatus Thalassarchaeaceae archaeon]
MPMLSRRFILAISLVILLCLAPHGAWIDVDATSGRSDDLDFSGGPNSGQILSGTYTVRATNVVSMDYIDVEVSDGSAWTPIANITTAPWLTAWDTSVHSDGDYQLRIEGTFTNSTTTGWVVSPTFTVDNTVPSGLSLTTSGAVVGDGSSTINRAWFTASESGTINFDWSGSDSHLSHATLTDVPGSGTPAQDGPGTILNTWAWSPGDLSEGVWNPVLSVFDEGGNSAQTSIHIGIDRSGPDVGTPSLSVSPGSWTAATTLIFNDLSSGADDNGGSGISTYHVRDSTEEWADIGAAGYGSMSLQEGIRTIQFRAVDRVGNIGDPLNVSIMVDRAAPVAGGWILPELTDSLSGQVTVTVDSTDTHSGIDVTSCSLEYGFDSNGAGTIPDISSDWLSVGSGTSNHLSAAIDWSTRAGQYLSLRATLVDTAGNTVTTTASHFLILPGLDFSISDASLDRLIVRAGSDDPVVLEATINTNEFYSGSVVVRIESAPASRDSLTQWTALNSMVIPANSFIDQQESISVNITLLTAGEFDLRVFVDPDEVISERDEGNNEVFLLIGAADPEVVGSVSGFAPDFVLLLLAGLFASRVINRRQSAS